MRAWKIDEQWDEPPTKEGMEEPLRLEDCEAVFICSKDSDCGIVITEPDQTGTFVIERGRQDRGNVFHPETEITIDDSVQTMTITI